MARDNKSLGKFQLTGIPPAPRGVPQIEVAFEIDANGILNVAARDKGTGREQSIRISNTGGLSQTEVERMRQEAETFAEDDVRRKQLVELKNQADSLFYSYETTIKDNAEFIDSELQATAQQQADALRMLLANPAANVDEVKQNLDTFQQVVFSIGTSVYQRASEGDGSGVASAGYGLENEAGLIPEVANDDDFSFDEDDTVTADYEAVD